MRAGGCLAATRRATITGVGIRWMLTQRHIMVFVYWRWHTLCACVCLQFYEWKQVTRFIRYYRHIWPGCKISATEYSGNICSGWRGWWLGWWRGLVKKGTAWKGKTVERGRRAQCSAYRIHPLSSRRLPSFPANPLAWYHGKPAASTHTGAASIYT